MQEHIKFFEKVLAKGLAFTTPDEQVAWDCPKDHVIGVHINVVISP